MTTIEFARARARAHYENLAGAGGGGGGEGDGVCISSYEISYYLTDLSGYDMYSLHCLVIE